MEELVKDKKTVLKIVTSLFLFVGLLASVTLVKQNQDISENAQTVDYKQSRCSSFTITPDKKAYVPGDELTITAVGQPINSGSIVGINVFYKKVPGELAIGGPGNGWNEVVGGTFNPTTKTWTGKWKIPENYNGEYMFTFNMTQSNQWVCSGNPGYACSGCDKGTMANWRVNDPGGTYSCEGCHKYIAVDSASGPLGTYNMKNYWNIKPGNSWTFSGNSYAYMGKTNTNPPQKVIVNRPVPIPFTTRFEIEEMSKLCNFNLYPMRITKDKAEGYWGPAGAEDNNGLMNLRFLLSAYDNSPKWYSQTLGALFHLTYTYPSGSANPISQLGTKTDFSNGVNTNIRMFNGGPGWIGSQYVSWTGNNYYAPYPLSSEKAFNGWSLSEDHYLIPVFGNFCDFSTYRNAAFDSWSVTTYAAQVATTAYTGPAVRVRFFEWGNGGGRANREDWYLAPNIGLVRLDRWDLSSQCGTPLPWICKTDAAPYPTTDLTKRPHTQLILSGFYAYDPSVTSYPSPTPNPYPTLSVNITSPTSNSIPVVNLSSPSSSKYTLRVRSRGKNYSGKLMTKACVTSTNVGCTAGAETIWKHNGRDIAWIGSNGLITVDLYGINLTPGFYHAQFKPVVESVPAGDGTGETKVTSTQLPWSKEIIIEVRR